MILDACCGALMMYHGWEKRLGDNFIYIDRRITKTHYYRGRKDLGWKIEGVKPLIKADMRYLPFQNSIFNIVICDPPYLNVPASRFFGEKYGSWSQSETIRTMKAANEEFVRVLKDSGILILKIFAKDYPMYEALMHKFIFFLPILYTSKSHHTKQTTGWYMATVKASPQMLPLTAYSEPQAQQAHPEPATQQIQEP